MMSSTTKNLELYDVEISEFSKKLKTNSAVCKVQKNTLLSPLNSKYKAIMDKCKHLAGINMKDIDTKPELLIQMIL